MGGFKTPCPDPVAAQGQPPFLKLSRRLGHYLFTTSSVKVSLMERGFGTKLAYVVFLTKVVDNTEFCVFCEFCEFCGSQELSWKAKQI